MMSCDVMFQSAVGIFPSESCFTVMTSFFAIVLWWQSMTVREDLRLQFFGEWKECVGERERVFSSGSALFRHFLLWPLKITHRKTAQPGLKEWTVTLTHTLTRPHRPNYQNYSTSKKKNICRSAGLMLTFDATHWHLMWVCADAKLAKCSML